MSTKFYRLISLIVLLMVIIINSFSVPVVAMGMQYLYQIEQLQSGASHNLIVALKEKLKEKGYYKGSINGEYDMDLDDALYDYREANGLQKDESLKETLKSLGLMNGN